MSSTACSLCHRPKANVSCELCGQTVCKKCTERLPADSFSYLEPVPETLSHRDYCAQCFNEKVAPELTEYEQTLRRAKGVLVFGKSKNEETRLFPRTEKPVRVEGSNDERDTLLRLAFRAAKLGCNVLLEVEIGREKVRNAGYQTTRWWASGVPSNVDPSMLVER